MIDLLVIRVLFIAVFAWSAFFLRPFDLDARLGALLGATAGIGVVLFEIRIKQVSLKRLIGAAFGSILGIVGAYLISLILSLALGDRSILHFLQIGVLSLMGYCGMVVGAAKASMLNLAALGGCFGGEKVPKSRSRYSIRASSSTAVSPILSRPVSSTELLVIPQFVLRELQLVADSSDSMKRNRGRRGLDILQRIQKMPQLHDADCGRRFSAASARWT